MDAAAGARAFLAGTEGSFTWMDRMDRIWLIVGGVGFLRKQE